MNDYSKDYLEECSQILSKIDTDSVDLLVRELAWVRAAGGRVFVLGIGGSAAIASHAALDFRKSCSIEAYSVTESFAEISARINDQGWDDAYIGWLESSRLDAKDALLIISVGGGDLELGVSSPLVRAMEYGAKVGSCVLALTGRDGGHAKKAAKVTVGVPPIFPSRLTPHTEGIFGVLIHLLVSHPRLNREVPRWESLTRTDRPVPPSQKLESHRLREQGN
jgi:D-sedoheptulose 7-phosphate isomerase